MILDCSTLLPGPFVGKLLAKQGAKVIKVENPDQPDGAREMGTYYQDLNEEKELVWLNLKKSEDRKKFHELLLKAHGLIEGFRPEAKKNLGLDAETLHAINPKLCILSMVGYPETGPLRDRAAHDLNFQAVTGALSLNNEMPGLPLADFFTAFQGAISLIASLHVTHRAPQGEANGNRIVVSMSETMREVQSLYIREFLATGKKPSYGETLVSGNFPCYRIYRSADGRRIAVGAIEKKFWKNLCEILNLKQYIEDGYTTGVRGKEVILALQDRFHSEPWSYWAPLFKKADCCVEPILDYEEVYKTGL